VEIRLVWVGASLFHAHPASVAWGGRNPDVVSHPEKDSNDGWLVKAKVGSYDSCRFVGPDMSITNRSDQLRSEASPRSAIRFAFGRIEKVRPPYEVWEPVVRTDIVQVPTFHAARAAANECFKNQSVDAKRPVAPVTVQVDVEIAVFRLECQLHRLPSAAPTTPHAAVAADAIAWKPWDVPVLGRSLNVRHDVALVDRVRSGQGRRLLITAVRPALF
jgi:hypothetical protein